MELLLIPIYRHSQHCFQRIELNFVSFFNFFYNFISRVIVLVLLGFVILLITATFCISK